MADLTLTSAADHLQIIHDEDTGEATLHCFNQPCFRISSSQMSALWKLDHDQSGGDRRLILGYQAPASSKMTITFDDNTNEAHLFLGTITSPTRVFMILPSQWGILLHRYNEIHSISN